MSHAGSPNMDGLNCFVRSRRARRICAAARTRSLDGITDTATDGSDDRPPDGVSRFATRRRSASTSMEVKLILRSTSRSSPRVTQGRLNQYGGANSNFSYRSNSVEMQSKLVEYFSQQWCIRRHSHPNRVTRMRIQASDRCHEDKKRQWSKPEIEEIELTQDILLLFMKKYPDSEALKQMHESHR